jgi:hypothetical protein
MGAPFGLLVAELRRALDDDDDVVRHIRRWASAAGTMRISRSSRSWPAPMRSGSWARMWALLARCIPWIASLLPQPSRQTLCRGASTSSTSYK